MSLSTPYLLYILGAYGVTLLGLGLFLGWSFKEWKTSARLFHDETHEA